MRIAVLFSGCLAFILLAFIAAGPLSATTTTLQMAVVRPTATAYIAPRPTATLNLPPAPTGTLYVQPAATVLPLATATMAAPTPTFEALDPPELRAVWVDAFHDGFKTPQQVDELVTWAREANLNALFVQMRRRGDAYYLKSFEPRAEDPDLAPGFDALQYLIDRAHQGPHRLQVHAWLATLPIWWQRDAPPAAPTHAFNLRGPSAGPADTWLMYRDDGEAWAGNDSGGMYYLDPGNPEVQSFTTEVYLNVLRNYDVDGIHLDQVRYYEGEALRWGYNPTSVARFNTQLGRDPDSQPAPSDPDWIAWRRDQVTALVSRIYSQAKAIKPSVAVTAAVVTWGKGPQSATDWETQAPYASVLQDWRGWLRQGIVDYVLPMDYYRDIGAQSDWFDTWTQWQVQYAGRRNVVLGLGSYLNTTDGVVAQLTRARALAPMGVALYSYAIPTSDLEHASIQERLAFADQLRSLFFARPAPAPTVVSAVDANR